MNFDCIPIDAKEWHVKTLKWLKIYKSINIITFNCHSEKQQNFIFYEIVCKEQNGIIYSVFSFYAFLMNLRQQRINFLAFFDKLFNETNKYADFMKITQIL